MFYLNESDDYSVKEYSFITEDLCNLEFYKKWVQYSWYDQISGPAGTVTDAF